MASTAILSSRFQITIPKEVRTAQNWKAVSVCRIDAQMNAHSVGLAE